MLILGILTEFKFAGFYCTFDILLRKHIEFGINFLSLTAVATIQIREKFPKVN